MKSNIDKFLDFEEKENLLDFYVNNYQVWPYIRFTVYMKIEALLNNQEKRVDNKQKISVREAFLIIKRCTLCNPLLTAKKCDILFVTHARRTLIDNKFECLYTDELASTFQNSSSMEFIYGSKHMEPVKTENLIYLDYIDIIPGGLYKLFEKKISKEDYQRLKEFCGLIDKKIIDIFGVNLGQDFLYNISKKRMVWHYAKKKMLKRLILKINPKVIVETVSYETNKMIINEIANELSIHTVELQHGVIGPGHVAYNYRENKKYNYLPEWICLFSDYWKHTSRFAQSDANLVCLGYPYMERMMQRYPKNEMKTQDSSEKRNILVLSQPEYSLKLYDEICQLVDILDNNNIKYNLLYKLHPSEYSIPKEQLGKLDKNSSVKIISTNSVNLYELFAKSNIQIGVTSTAIYEGLAYGLYTLILHYEKTDTYMGDICSKNYAIMCETAKDLADKIQSYDFENCQNDNEDFFMTNATSNITKFLNELLTKGK